MDDPGDSHRCRQQSECTDGRLVRPHRGRLLRYSLLPGLYVWHNRALLPGDLLTPTRERRGLPEGPTGLPGKIDRIARNLVVDATVAEVATALEQKDVACIVLKGATISRWLYEDTASRRYSDCDLLVSPDHLAAAGKVLAWLGFRAVEQAEVPRDRPVHGRLWMREGSAPVDLHARIPGVGVDPSAAWSILSSHTERFEVAGAQVDVLRPSGRALLVAMHAAQHGPRLDKPIRDLERATSRLSDGVWRDSTLLAEALEASDMLSAGLRLVEGGERLADQLGLPPAGSTEARLLASRVPTHAITVEWLAQMPGVRAKVGFFIRKTWPSVAYMRAISPVAKEGGIGVARAYVIRTLHLVRASVPTIQAWRRARRGDTL